MTNGYRPGLPFTLSSPYGDRNDPFTKERKFHSGQDYGAPAGTPIPTAASGVVVYSGFNENLGNVVIVKNDTGDYSLYGHLQDGNRARLGQRIWPSDIIGLVGSTGARAHGAHLHYSLIRKEIAERISKTDVGGPIGVNLNRQNTMDPAQYDNYDPTPRYLDESTRAAELLAGGYASVNPGTLSPNRPSDPFFSLFGQPLPASAGGGPSFISNGQNSFADRFGQWGSTQAGASPTVSDAAADFSDRFGSWRLLPPGTFGNVRAPNSTPPSLGRRSDIPNGGTPTSAQPTPSAWPFLAADAGGFGGVSKYAAPNGTEAGLPLADPNMLGFSLPGIAGDDNVPERRLVGRVVNLSASSTNAPSLSPGQSDATSNGSGNWAAVQPTSPPLAPNQTASSSPALGLFSGQPMPDWSVPPPIFQSKDQASPEDNELWQRLRAMLDD